MRAWSRDEQGKWTLVDGNTDPSNFYLTAMAQQCKLVLGESPFWANAGIPAQQSVVTQVYPDYYVQLIQQRFAPYFASLKLTKVPGTDRPSYRFDVMTLKGQPITGIIAI